jgi:hypothetical protein
MSSLEDLLLGWRKQEPKKTEEKKQPDTIAKKADEPVIDIFAEMLNAAQKKETPTSIIAVASVVASNKVDTNVKSDEQLLEEEIKAAEAEAAEAERQADEAEIASVHIESVKLIEEAPNIAEMQKPEIIVEQTPIAIAEPKIAIDNSAIAEKSITIKKERKWRTPCNIELVMEQEEVEERFKHAKLNLQSACFFICLDTCGIRKMELATMRVNQAKLTDKGIELSFVRLKHSAQTLPILLKKDWFGVSEYVIPWYKLRLNAKPSHKRLYHFHTERGAIISEKLHTLDDGSTYIEKIRAKGREITETEVVKDLWMFPNISKQTALTIAKKVYGKNLYAHYGRARRLSTLLSNPKASVTLAKSFSGIKSTRIIEKYMMQSKKSLDQAIDLIDEDFKVKA